MRYAREGEVFEGDKLVADGGFTCLTQGEVRTVLKDADGYLYVPCSEGEHYIAGQLSHGKPGRPWPNSSSAYMGFTLANVGEMKTIPEAIERRFQTILEEIKRLCEEIKRLCEEGTQGHGDEFYGPILEQVEKLERL